MSDVKANSLLKLIFSDPPNLHLLKMIFGFMLLILLALLAAIIALGKVHMESSFGLTEILGGLLVLSGGFAHWAFGDQPSQSKDEVLEK